MYSVGRKVTIRGVTGDVTAMIDESTRNYDARDAARDAALGI